MEGRSLGLLRLLPAAAAVHLFCAPSPLAYRFYRPTALPYSADCYVPAHSLTERKQTVQDTIPSGDGVSIENDVVMGALLAGRPIRIFPEGTESPEKYPWVVLSPGGGHWVLDRHDPGRYEDEVRSLEEKGYRWVRSAGGLDIYRFRGK